MPPDRRRPSPSLEVAPEVARAVGAAAVMRLRADPTLDEYVCCICDRPGRAELPGSTSVIATRYTGGVTYLRLAHTDCSPSTLISLLGDFPLRRHRIRAHCWLRQPEASAADAGSTATLLISNDVRGWPRRLAREAVDHYTRALVTIGFTTLHDLDDEPGLVAGLTVAMKDGGTDPPEGTGLFVAHPTGVVFDGALDVPDDWRQIVEDRGRLVVLTATPFTGYAPSDLASAVAAGRVLAATATLSDKIEDGHASDSGKYRRSA